MRFVVARSRQYNFFIIVLLSIFESLLKVRFKLCRRSNLRYRSLFWFERLINWRLQVGCYFRRFGMLFVGDCLRWTDYRTLDLVHHLTNLTDCCYLLLFKDLLKILGKTFLNFDCLFLLGEFELVQSWVLVRRSSNLRTWLLFCVLPRLLRSKSHRRFI